jgi:hypothetical protein
VFEHKRGSLYFAVALLDIIVLPCIVIPGLLVLAHGFPSGEYIGGIPEDLPIGEGLAFGFFHERFGCRTYVKRCSRNVRIRSSEAWHRAAVS